MCLPQSNPLCSCAPPSTYRKHQIHGAHTYSRPTLIHHATPLKTQPSPTGPCAPNIWPPQTTFPTYATATPYTEQLSTSNATTPGNQLYHKYEQQTPIAPLSQPHRQPTILCLLLMWSRPLHSGLPTTTTSTAQSSARMQPLLHL